MKQAQMNRPQSFCFVTEKTLRQNTIELSRWQSANLRSKLPKGIYWLQPEKKGQVYWNTALLVDYLINGGDSPHHQALVEKYLATLPKVG